MGMRDCIGFTSTYRDFLMVWLLFSHIYIVHYVLSHSSPRTFYSTPNCVYLNSQPSIKLFPPRLQPFAPKLTPKIITLLPCTHMPAPALRRRGHLPPHLRANHRGSPLLAAQIFALRVCGCPRAEAQPRRGGLDCGEHQPVT